MTKISLTENHSRGFLSNYTTILITLRNLVGRLGYDPKNIFVSSSMFSLYGNPKNWFDPSKVIETSENVSYYDTLSYFDIYPWSTMEELNLFWYTKYFSYNERIEKYIKENLLNIKNCLGIHYRGTDHYHTNEIPIEAYYDFLYKNINQYEQVFICTDESNIIDQFVEYLNKEFKFDNVVFNNTIKCDTKIGLHNSFYDSKTKILLGDQVLLDSHSLSECKTIVCKTSNIINYARILNLDLEVHYLDKNSSFR